MAYKIYNRIKIYRIESGLTRKQLAKKVGVNFQTIGYLERGDFNPSLELAFKLSGVFGVNINELFSVTPFTKII